MKQKEMFYHPHHHPHVAFICCANLFFHLFQKTVNSLDIERIVSYKTRKVTR